MYFNQVRRCAELWVSWGPSTNGALWRSDRSVTSVAQSDATEKQAFHIHDTFGRNRWTDPSHPWQSSVTVGQVRHTRDGSATVSVGGKVCKLASFRKAVWKLLEFSPYVWIFFSFIDFQVTHLLSLPFFFFFPVVEGRRYLTVIVLHNEQIHVRSRRNCRPSPLPALTPSCGCDVPKVRCFKSVVQMNHPSYGKTASDGSRITHPQETPTPSSDKSF